MEQHTGEPEPVDNERAAMLARMAKARAARAAKRSAGSVGKPAEMRNAKKNVLHIPRHWFVGVGLPIFALLLFSSQDSSDIIRNTPACATMSNLLDLPFGQGLKCAVGIPLGQLGDLRHDLVRAGRAFVNGTSTLGQGIELLVAVCVILVVLAGLIGATLGRIDDEKRAASKREAGR